MQLSHDLTGKRFGRIVVIEKYPQKTWDKKSRWVCKCDCGTVKIITGSTLIQGSTLSCGCLRDYLKKCPTKTHVCKTQRISRGRYLKGSGYIYLYNPCHPNSSGGCVFEHVVVMSETIGRPLRKGETVHHKNGIRSDNRPENLELWVKAHGSGQRVEDVIKDALRILKDYPEMIKKFAI